MEKYKKRIWLLLGILLTAGLLYLQSVFAAKELADRRLQESFETIKSTQIGLLDSPFPLGHEAYSQAELPYIKEMRYDQKWKLVYEEQALIDNRYAQLLAKKKDGLKLDLVVFRYFSSETELSPILQVTLSEFYYRQKNGIYQLQPGSTPILKRFYLWKDGSDLVLDHLVTDRARFFDLLREKLGAKHLESSKIEDLLLLVSDLHPDHVIFKKDSLDLSFDEEGIYLQIAYDELGGLINSELRIE